MGMSELECRVWLCAAILSLVLLTLAVFLSNDDFGYMDLCLVSFACIGLYVVEIKI